MGLDWDSGLTYVEAADVENDHLDLGVDGLVLLVDQQAVVHLQVENMLFYLNKQEEMRCFGGLISAAD